MATYTLHVEDRHIDAYLEHDDDPGTTDYRCSIELAAAEKGLSLSVGTKRIVDLRSDEWFDLPEYVTLWIKALDLYISFRGDGPHRPYPLTFTIEIPDATE